MNKQSKRNGWLSPPKLPTRPPAHNTAAAMIFSPAIALMNRLGYTRKLVLLGFMSLVAIVVMIYGLFTSLDLVIRTAQRELEGIALIKPFYRTTQIIQQHRGLSAVLLSGDKPLQDRRAAKETEAVEAFKEMEEKLPPSLASSKDLQHIKTSWERLRKDGLNWTVDENFAAHTRLINQIRLFEIVTADEYALTLDPEINTYYLIDSVIQKLPNVIERLGRIRAYGTGILAERHVTAQQHVKIDTMIAELGDALEDLRVNLEKTARLNPTMQGSISVASNNIADSAQQITALVATDIIAAHFTTRPNEFYGLSTVAIDKGYAQLYELLLPMSETLLKVRIVRAKNDLHTNIGIAFLLFLVGVYFSIGICYAIFLNIQSLARSAHAFAGGDLHERIHLGTRDELSQVGDSFNEMADGFSTLLEAQKLAEKKLAESYRKLQQLALHLDNVREEEQERIAREIHDEMGATLTALKMRIHWLASKLPPEMAQFTAETEHIDKLVTHTIHTMRHVISQLMPTQLHDLGFADAVERYVQDFQKNTRIECGLVLPEEGLMLDDNQSSAIFRILQESLNNVAKHAQATKVSILIIDRDHSLILLVKDNGVGFDRNVHKNNSFGLLGIRERALMVNGKARISSKPGQGTQVVISIPLAGK